MVDRIVQLAISVRQFLSVYHQLEAFGQSRFATVHLSQRTHLNRIVDDEGRLDKRTLAELPEDLVDQFTFTHRIVDLHLQFLADRTDLVLALTFQVVTRLFLDRLQDRQAAERSLEADCLTVDRALARTVHGDTDTLQQLLSEAHHPVIVFVLDIKFHTSELRVVRTVHTLVTEILTDLVYTLESTDDQSFQIQLGSDTQIQIDIQRVVMRDEWTCAGSSCDRLQDRSLYLRISGLIQGGTHGLDDSRTFHENIFYTLVYYQIHVTLAITKLRVIKTVVSDTVLIFNDR